MDFFLECLRKPRASASGLAPGGQPRAAVPTCINGYFCGAFSFWYDALNVPLLWAIGNSVG